MSTPALSTPALGTPANGSSGGAGASPGFTLLEILVALTVFSLLLVGLTQGARFGTLATDRQAHLVSQIDNLDAVDRLLRRSIEQIEPLDQSGAPPLRGTSAEVAFTSEMPRHVVLRNHHAAMRLLVDPGHRLVLRWSPVLHVIRSGPTPTPTDTILLSGVDHLVLAYWPGSGRADQTWRSRWDAPTPPALVRIGIVFLPGDARQWPDIVAAPLREQL